MWHFYTGNYSQIYFDICNYICLDTSYHFWLYLYFLNIVLYFFKYDCTNIFHRRSLCTFYIAWAIDIESICTKIPKRINWYSQHIVSFHCNDITLTVSIGNVLYSQSHDPVEHTAKLKTSSPWASALVLSFDFRGSTNDQTTTKVALSAVEMPLRRYASRTILLGFEIYFTEDFEPTNQTLREISCHTTYCTIHKGTKVIALHMLRQQICLDMTISCFYHFNKISY